MSTNVKGPRFPLYETTATPSVDYLGCGRKPTSEPSGLNLVPVKEQGPKPPSISSKRKRKQANDSRFKVVGSGIQGLVGGTRSSLRNQGCQRPSTTKNPTSVRATKNFAGRRRDRIHRWKDSTSSTLQDCGEFGSRHWYFLDRRYRIVQPELIAS